MATEITRTTTLETALACGAHGWNVFPTEGGRRISYNESRGGVYLPRVDVSTFLASTTDSKLIEAWWSMHPDSEIGVETGIESNLFVIELDRYGREEWARRFGELPKTMSHTALGDRLQLFFSYPEWLTNLVNRMKEDGIRLGCWLGKGFGIKGDRETVVMHPGWDRRSGIEKQELLPIPGYVIRYFKPEILHRSTRTPECESVSGYLDTSYRTMITASKDRRNRTLGMLAYKLGRLVVANGMEPDAIYDSESPPLRRPVVATGIDPDTVSDSKLPPCPCELGDVDVDVDFVLDDIDFEEQSDVPSIIRACDSDLPLERLLEIIRDVPLMIRDCDSDLSYWSDKKVESLRIWNHITSWNPLKRAAIEAGMDEAEVEGVFESNYRAGLNYRPAQTPELLTSAGFEWLDDLTHIWHHDATYEYLHGTTGFEWLTTILFKTLFDSCGTKGDALNTLAYKLGRQVAANRLEPEAEDALKYAALRAGLCEVEVERAFQNGYRAGLN